ncbi:PKD domain-containing protein [Croceimicrobium hydrocarbonivorans]|uniref:Right-handed parallel beta-helix repeat-containing protein n=1 Tax=Croceimicrobium hydrocarbonivorans TaxID=2761580 RepID=A0A7H0VJ95_9FLAO|nr:PKD domain-containing protein [Croceimicrobium hydrocarbonivorans]QNR25793.1 right-handed parallel beta-helix repeat-containing protein [Croceimicrobium hydrocarbonivorans]
MKKVILSLLGLVSYVGANAQCNLSTPASLPYVQSFNSLSGTINTDSVFICDPSAKWSFEGPGTSAVMEMGIPSGTSGITGDFQGTSLGVASVTRSDTANLILTIDLSNVNATDPEDIYLSFYYADFADEEDAIDQVFLRGSDSDTWITIFDWNNGSPSDWQRADLKIDSILTANSQNFSATTQIRWSEKDDVGLTSGDGLGLDQVSIISTTTAAPTSASISNVTATSVDVAWTSVSPHTQIVVGPAGFYWPNATKNVFSGQSTATLNSLSPATHYEVWLRDSTATGNLSVWRGPFAFITSCVPFTAPYFTNFDITSDGDFEPCWADYHTYSSAYGRVEALTSGNATQPFSGGNVLEIYNSFSSLTDTILAITPEFADMTAGDKQIRFMLAASDASTDLIVATLSTNSLGAIATIIDTIDIAANNTWQEVAVPLTSANGYNGTDKYIALIHNRGGGTYDDIYIDDFNYEVIPACPRILTASFTNVSFNSAVMNFSSTSDSVQVEWGPAGFTKGTGCIGNAVNGPVTISDALDPTCATSLAPVTTYDVYIRNNCTTAGDGYSTWSGPFSFTTTCAPYTAPYFTDFDATSDGDFEPCWIDFHTYSSAYGRVETLSSTNATQPFSGSNVLEIYNSGSSTTDTLLAISPEFSDMVAGDKQIRFMLAANDANTDLIVATLNTNLPGAVATFIDTIDIISSNTWQEVAIPLTTALGYNGTDKYIALIHNRGGGTYDDIYIDDFHYEVIPPCPKIYGATFSSISHNSAVMNFTSTSDSVQVEWGPTGFTQGTGCLANEVNGPLLISDALDPSCSISLAPQSTYDVYIRNNCTTAGDGYSTWNGPYSFTTGCAPIIPPHVEDFSAGFVPDVCWDEAGDGDPSTGPTGLGSGSWISDGFANIGTTGAVKVNMYAASKNEWILTPSYDLGSTIPMQMEFDFGVFDFGNSTPDSIGSDDMIQVLISTDNGANWNALDTIDQTFKTLPGGNHLIYPLTSYSGVVRFAIWATEGTVNDPGDVDAMVDNFEVRPIPSCAASNAVILDSASSHDASFSWTAGSGLSFEIQVDTTGFTVGTARFGDTVTVTNTTIYGLSPNTEYEFYIRDICGGADGTSIWSGPFTFRTECLAVFATPVLFDLEDLTIGSSLAFDNCWTSDRTSAPGWEIEEADGTDLNSTSTGPDYDHTLGTSGGKYWFLETSSGSTGSEANLTSPAFDLSSLTEPSLYFWYHMYGSSMGNLHIDIEHNGIWYTDYYLIEGEQDTSGADDWNLMELNLAAFVNDTIHVRFRGERGTSYYSDMSIDDIEIAEASNCSAPLLFTSSNLSPTSIDLDWSSYGGQYNVAWGTQGFLQGTNTSAGNVNSGVNPPYTLGSLTPNNYYDVYVQDTCNNGLWVGPISFKTPCTSPLAGGTYTIGTSPSDDFPSFDSVAAVLNGCGISGPVVFNVQAGTYVDKLHLQSVAGVSGTNTITFNGTGGSDTLIYNGQSHQTAVLIENTSQVTLNAMTIVNNGSSEAFGILLMGNSDTVTISNTTVIVDTTGSGSDVIGILTSGSYENDFTEGADVDYLTIESSTIIGGYTGINLEGTATNDPAMHIMIRDNHVYSQYTYGIYVDEAENISFIGNTIDKPRATTDGIYCFDMKNVLLEGNHIAVTDYAVYLSDINDGYAVTTPSRLVNNMISSTTDYGIYLNDFENIEVYHNTVMGEPAMAINDQDTVWVVNNIFVSTGDFAFESFDNFNASEHVDYNLYLSGNSDAFDIGTSTHTTLADWQTADAVHNANSLYGDPLFNNAPEDLHVFGVIANDVGDNSIGITVDIDGDIRPQAPSTTVDMGADEYTPKTDDAYLTEIIAAAGCGDSTTAVSLVFQNLGQNTITSLPVSVNLSGGLTATLNAIYSGNLSAYQSDTVLVGTYNTYAGAQGVLIDGLLNLSGDQDASNDSLSAGPFNYLPYEPVGYDSTYCPPTDTAYLRAKSITGVNYAWFASNSVNDTVPIATGDTLAVPTAGAQSTYYLKYESAQDSLGTPFVGGNNQNGNCFDILPSANIELTALDLSIIGTGPQDVMVYYRPGTHVGHEASLSGWIRLDSLTVNANGSGNPTYVPLSTPATLYAGNTYAIMVVAVGVNLNYTDGTAVGTVLAQNDYLTIFEGAGISWPLSSVFTPRFWNGRLYYNTIACSDMRVPVQLTAGADTATAAFSVGGSQPNFTFDASASVNADTYTWDFGDGNTGTGVSTSHTYTSNGVYNVVLTVNDTTDCYSVAMDSTTIEVNIGLEENPLQTSLAVYPNPASDYINVEFDVLNSANAKIRLLDAQGRALSESNERAQGDQFRYRLDVSQLASGVYILEIESGDRTAQERISIR